MDTAVIIMICIIACCMLGIALTFFFKLSKKQQLEIVQNWLLLAVVQAEKELGGGTGQLKLRYVYDLFLQKFNFLSKVITFAQFSSLVDEALVVMKQMIADNKNVENYINK